MIYIRMPEKPAEAVKHGEQGKNPAAGTVETALGMEFSSLTGDLRQKFSIKNRVASGVLVTNVDPDSAAANKHIQPGGTDHGNQSRADQGTHRRSEKNTGADERRQEGGAAPRCRW
jgi:hypothetical protein